MPWSLGRLTEAVEKLQQALPLTFDWYTGRTQPPVQQTQIVFWEDVDNEVAKILMRRGSKTYVFTSYLAQPGSNSVTIHLDAHAHRHASGGSALADTATDPIGPYNFTWTGIHIFTPGTNTTPITVNAGSALTSSNMTTWNPAEGEDTVITYVGDMGIGEPTPTAMLSIKQRSQPPVTIDDILAIPDIYALWWANSVDGNNNESYSYSASGVNVLTWIDLTGNGHDLVPSSGSTIRLRKQDPANVGPNAQGWLQAVGSAEGWNQPWPTTGAEGTPEGTFGNPGGWTVFCVGQKLANPASGFHFIRGGYLSEGRGQSGTNAIGFPDSNIAGTKFCYTSAWGNADLVDGFVRREPIAPTAWPTLWYSMCWVFEGGTTFKCYLQGVEASTNVTGLAAVNAGRVHSNWNCLFRNGVWTGGSQGSYVNHPHAFIALFQRKLEEDERLLVEQFLTEQYDASFVPAIESTPIQDWKEVDGTIDSIVDDTFNWGIGIDEPEAKFHIYTDGEHLRLGNPGLTDSITAYTSFIVDSGSAAIKYHLPVANALSTVGILHNSIPAAGVSTWSWSLVSLTADVSGVLGLDHGGTAKDLSLAVANGGIVYTDADSMEILAPTATARQILLSGSSSVPSWSNATFPASAVMGDILYASAANVWTQLPITPNIGWILTSNGTIPVWEAPSSGLLTAEYRFDTSTTASDPGAGRLRFNTGTFSTVTAIYLDTINGNGTDVSAILGTMQVGDQFLVQDQDVAANLARYQLTATPTDNTGWWTVPVSHVSSSGSLFANNEPLVIGVTSGATGIYQPLDGNLTAIAALVPVRGDLIGANATPEWENFGYRILHDTPNSATFANLFFGKNAGNFTNSANGAYAFGEEALNFITSGSDDVALGYWAGRNITTGTGNAALSPGALFDIVTGSYNIGVGISAGPDGDYENTITIGAFAICGAPNKTVIGNTGAELGATGTQVVELRGVLQTRDPNTDALAIFDTSLLPVDATYTLPPSGPSFGGGTFWVDGGTSVAGLSAGDDPILTWISTSFGSTGFRCQDSSVNPAFFDFIMDTSTGIVTCSSDPSTGGVSGWKFTRASGAEGGVAFFEVDGSFKAGTSTLSTVNKVTITQPSSNATLTIDNGKTFRVSNSIRLIGTDSTEHTFPTTNSELARKDAAQTFQGIQTFAARDVHSSGINLATSGVIASDAMAGPSAVGMTAFTDVADAGTAGTTANIGFLVRNNTKLTGSRILFQVDWASTTGTTWQPAFQVYPVQAAGTTKEMKLLSDTSNHLRATVTSAGVVTFTATGSAPTMTFTATNGLTFSAASGAVSITGTSFSAGAGSGAISFSTSGAITFGTGTITLDSNSIKIKDGTTISSTATIVGFTIAGASDKLCFFGIGTPVGRPTTLTQTYSSTNRTHAALTSATLTDSSGGTANTTVQALTNPADSPASADALRDDLVANLIPELRNNFADLAAQVNALRVDIANAKDFLNSAVDDLQSLGLLQ